MPLYRGWGGRAKITSLHARYSCCHRCHGAVATQSHQCCADGDNNKEDMLLLLAPSCCQLVVPTEHQWITMCLRTHRCTHTFSLCQTPLDRQTYSAREHGSTSDHFARSHEHVNALCANGNLHLGTYVLITGFHTWHDRFAD